MRFSISFPSRKTFYLVSHCPFCLLYAVPGFGNSQGRFRSSYVGRFSRRGRETDEFSDAVYLKEMYQRNDPEAVIRLFESQPSLHSNPTAIGEYVKALVKVDRLDESELLKALQRGWYLENTFYPSSSCFVLVSLA